MTLQLNAKISAIVLIALSLSGCFGQMARDSGAKGQDVFEAIHDRLTKIRGLKFTGEVGLREETREGLRGLLESNLGRGPGGKSVEDTSLAYEKLGLIPQGTDLRTGSLKYYSAITLAFYDSERKRIVYVGSLSNRQGSAMLPHGTEKIIVHELTHALQDQQFAVGDRLRSSQNSDAALALRALAEGDALVTEYAYSFGGLNEGLSDFVRQVLDGTGDDSNPPPGTPVMVADKLRFQYWAGARFVLHFVGKNSWLPINLIYEHPPLSTKQILHPEKYLAEPDPPTHVTLSGLSGLFPAEWTEIESDTLGELMVQCLVKQFLAPDVAAMVGSGWDGDRFVAFRKGDDTAFIWATVWDSANDAREFYDAYHKILSIKYRISSDNSQFYVEKRDRSVIVIEGVDRTHVKSNIDAIWTAMRLEKEHFRRPPLASWLGNN